MIGIRPDSYSYADTFYNLQKLHAEEDVPESEEQAPSAGLNGGCMDTSAQYAQNGIDEFSYKVQLKVDCNPCACCCSCC
jgi:hypothetical protein